MRRERTRRAPRPTSEATNAWGTEARPEAKQQRTRQRGREVQGDTAQHSTQLHITSTMCNLKSISNRSTVDPCPLVTMSYACEHDSRRHKQATATPTLIKRARSDQRGRRHRASVQRLGATACMSVNLQGGKSRGDCGN